MTKDEKKNIIALRKYWQYLKARFNFIEIGIIDISDNEFQNMCNTRNLYKMAFSLNAGFKYWLIEKNHESRPYKCAGNDLHFYNIAIQLRDEILRSER